MMMIHIRRLCEVLIVNNALLKLAGAFAPVDIVVRTRMIRTGLFSAVALPETSPLPPHTFAGMVESGMIQKFGEENVVRILQSWRLLEKGYEHREFVGNGDANTSNMHQLCLSYVPGLTIQEFWDTDKFPWCGKLQAKYKAIRDEFKRVTEDMDKLVQEGNNIWAGALTQDASSYGEGWKTLVLMDRSFWDPVNVNLFPVTAKAVHESGVPAVEVFFASMQPHTDIKPHSDFTNFVLTSHLPIDIPYSGQNKCRLTIGDTERQWINGELLLFDTSLMHDAVNESDKTRYILMLRLWHPDLTDIERQALQFTYDCLEFPEIATADGQERIQAELSAEAAKIFPEIKKGAGKKVGFGGTPLKSSKKKKK
jgi:aspartate beta-hydroxylase